jgi:hypothetical protein
VTAIDSLEGLIVMFFIALNIKGLIWSITFDMLSTTAKKTPFLQWIWRICQMRRTKRRPSYVLCNLREAFQETVDDQTRCISIWCTLWRTEHFQASKLHSQHHISWKFRNLNLLQYRGLHCTDTAYGQTLGTLIYCILYCSIVIHSMLHNTTDMDLFSWVQYKRSSMTSPR